MLIAPPVAPVLGRITAIAARFEPRSTRLDSAKDPALSNNSMTLSRLGSTSSFEAILADALGGDSTSGTDRAFASGDSIDLRGLDLAGMGLGRLGGEQAVSETGLGDGPSTGHDVVDAATRYLGVPYKWGGTDPAKGLDCSGLVQRACADVGISLPRTSYDQAKAGVGVASLAEARPGDLVAFGEPVDHIGIYIGEGRILQAPHSGDVVRVTDIKRPITAIRRVVPEERSVGAATTESVPVAGATNSAIPGSAPYAQLFADAGARHGVDPKLLAAVAKVESNFNPGAVSPAGAVGLMQIMPATARGLGVDPADPAQAVDGAARYLATQLRDFGDVGLALAAYNAGPGAVRRFGGIPPYAETRSYVSKVLGQFDRTRLPIGVSR